MSKSNILNFFIRIPVAKSRIIIIWIDFHFQLHFVGSIWKKAPLLFYLSFVKLTLCDLLRELERMSFFTANKCIGLSSATEDVPELHQLVFSNLWSNLPLSCHKGKITEECTTTRWVSVKRNLRVNWFYIWSNWRILMSTIAAYILSQYWLA